MIRLAALLILGATPLVAASQSTPQHLQVHVRMPADTIASGRLLVFAVERADKLPPVLGVDPFAPNATYVAAKEVPTTPPGTIVDIDVDELVYPRDFSSLAAGHYVLQALLDTGHTYSYGGTDPADWISDQVPMDAPLSSLTLALSHHPEPSPLVARAAAALKPGTVEEIDCASAKLTAFFGHETHITGAIALPPGYTMSRSTYPVAFLTHGFGANHTSNILGASRAVAAMSKGDYPPMIYAYLDESLHTGTHEFADSVNNGPWGGALVNECIPQLEERYRMDAKRESRFLNGHSSGGWATLHLQIDYPETFDGTWSTSPDSSDFHDFTGVDLYAAHANAFHTSDGRPIPLVRDKGKVLATFEQFSRLEEVLGTEGGQLRSFDWVFSPRGADGRPVPVYDRQTGIVDPAVVRYWHDHSDLSYRLEQQWPAHAAELRGRIHVYVGTADTFYLDGAAHYFDRTMERLNTGTRVVFLAGRTHFDLYVEGEDKAALAKKIYWAMYAQARPGGIVPMK